tara:strand:- start:228 stop:1970 length:1743 start_codon:yes stop_codon:yes gene_type:complete
MQDGGNPIQAAFDKRQELYRGIIGPSDLEDQAMLDERKKMSKSQMYFDIAETALAFATPGSRQMSPAERLADSVRETGLLPKLGARGQAVQDLKDKQQLSRRATNQSIDMAALGAAEKDVEGQQSIAAALAKARLNQTQNPMELVLSDGTVQLIDRDTVDLAAVNKMGATVRPLTKVPAGSKTFIDADTGVVLGQVSNKNEDQFIADQIKLGNNPVAYTYKVDKTSFSPSEATALITDQKILDGFADGTLTGTNFNRFENTLIGQIREKTITTATGEVIRTPGQPLTGAQKKAIEDRLKLDPDSVSLELKEYVRPSLNDVLPYSAKDLDALMAEQNTPDPSVPSTLANRPTTTLNRDVLQSPEFKQSLLNNSGTIDVNAKGFTLMPTQTVNDLLSEGIDPSIAQGLSRIKPALKLFFTEPLSDVFGVNVPKDAKNLVTAEVALTNIAQRTRQLLIDNREGNRMLSPEYEKLEEQISGILPGTFVFDTSGLAVLKGAIGLVAEAMDTDLEAVPEWGGSTTDGNATRLAKRRTRLRTGTALLGELVQLRNALTFYVDKNQDVVGKPMKDVLKNASYRKKPGD